MADNLAISLVLTADARDQLAKLAQVKQATRDTYDSATQTITRASATSATAVRNATAQMTTDQQKAASGFGDMAKAALGLGAAFAGIAAGVAAGAATINAAMTKVAESTQKAAQAQFALNALYGQAAPIVTKQAEDLAKASGRSRTEALEAATAVATLGRSYALTFDQQKKVLEISANLAAVRGIPLEEATKRVSDAIRGEAEAAEYLGQVLNSDAVKAFANMTAEQRKNFDSLDPLTKAQIVLGKLIGDNADLMGKAAERANGAAGASDKFDASINNLATSIGQRFSPVATGALGVMSGFVDRADEFVRSDFLKRLEQTATIFGAMATLDPAKIAGALQAAQAAFLPDFQVGPDPGSPGGANLGPTSPATTAAIDEERRRQTQRIAADRKNAAKAELDAAQKANDATVESAIKAIDAERKAKEAWYGEERQRVEARRTYQLEDIEARKDAEIERIKKIAEAQKDADKAAIEDAERRKRVELDAIQEATDQTIKALDARKDELSRARELEDRERSDAQRSANAQIKAARDAEDHERETSHRDETRRRDDQHKAAVEALKDEQEAREEASRKALRGIEEEADAERKNSDRALRNLDRRATREDDRHRKALSGIERQGDAEDERHRRAMESLDDERDAQLSILDVQLRALDAAERSEDSAARTSDLQQRLSRAQQALTAAQGTGTPGEVAGGIQDLSQALRSGNDVSIANARERLAKLAGQGAEAIKAAQQDVADAERELREASVKETRDAERQKLKDAQDAIRSKSDSEKEAEDERTRLRKDALDADKEAEDERSRLRKSGFAADRQAEQDKLKDRLEALDARKTAEQDAARADLDGIRTRVEAEGKAHDDAVRLANDEYAERTRLLGQRREDEDAALEALRLAEAREREDNRAAEDKDLGVQRANAASNQETMRKDTEVHYNGANGIITQLRKASEDHAREHSTQLAIATKTFADERKAAELIYTNPEGNGLLQNLEKARASEFEKLEASKTQWQEWGEAASKAIKAATADLDAFIARGANIPRVGSDGSVSNTNPRPSIDGRPVQGPGFDDDGPPQNAQQLAARAKPAADRHGLPIEVIAAIAGNESGFGANASMLATKYHNWFGVKGSGDAGQTPALKTWEVINGKRVEIMDRFAAYSSDEAAFDAFAKQFSTGRYAKAAERYRQTGNPVDYLQGIFDAGYATDPNWVSKVRRLGGFDAGGLISEPHYLLSMRTNRITGSIAEHGPEMVTGRAQTAAMMSGGFDEDRLVRVMARAVAASRPIVMNGTSEDLYRKVRRHLDQNSREHDSLRRRS